MMAMAASTASGAATTTSRKNTSSSSFLFLMCGCKDAKAVSVSSPHSDCGADKTTAASLSGRHDYVALSARPDASSADTLTLTTTTTTTLTTTFASHDDGDSPSFSGLLRQLSELEQSVAALDCHRPTDSDRSEAGETGESFAAAAEDKGLRTSSHMAGGNHCRRKGRSYSKNSADQQRRHQSDRHRRSQSEGSDVGGGHVIGRVGESLAVVKETEDPLGDFRRSMLQMIVENEIVDGEELRQLLRRFLALNSPSHHPIIVRAFADIWGDVFAGYGDETPAVLLLPTPLHHHSRLLRPRRRNSYHGHSRCQFASADPDDLKLTCS